MEQKVITEMTAREWEQEQEAIKLKDEKLAKAENKIKNLKEEIAALEKEREEITKAAKKNIIVINKFDVTDIDNNKMFKFFMEKLDECDITYDDETRGSIGEIFYLMNTHELFSNKKTTKNITTIGLDEAEKLIKEKYEQEIKDKDAKIKKLDDELFGLNTLSNIQEMRIVHFELFLEELEDLLEDKEGIFWKRKQLKYITDAINKQIDLKNEVEDD